MTDRMFAIQQRTKASQAVPSQSHGWYIGHSLNHYFEVQLPFYLNKKGAKDHLKYLKSIYPKNNKYEYEFRIVELEIKKVCK